jgi:hypothetical protein
MNNDDAIRDLILYLDETKGEVDMMVDEPPTDIRMLLGEIPGGLRPSKEIARAIMRMLAPEMDLPADFLPGDVLCGNCGENYCTAPDTVEVDPVCWDCVARFKGMDPDNLLD